MTRLSELPEGARKVLAAVLPDGDFEEVIFHEGLPSYVMGTPRAITIGPKIYFRAGQFEPCSFKGIALLAHELLHVDQGAGGLGWWFVRWFYIKYAWLWLRHGFTSGSKHPLEEPGYDLQHKVEEYCARVLQSTGEPGPCTDLAGNEVGVNQAFVDAFAAEWTGS